MSPGRVQGARDSGPGELTKVVGAGSELGNLEPGGSGRNPQDLLIAQRAPPVREVPRDQVTGRVIPPTDSTAVWTPARAKDPITARALEKSKVRQGHLKPDTTSHLGLLLLGPFSPPCTLICAQVRVSVSPPVPSQPQGSPDVPEGSLLGVHLWALLAQPGR